MNDETSGALASSNRGASDLVAALLHRAPRLATAVALGQATWPLARAWRAKLLSKRSYTVKVSSTDEIYDDLHEWVLSLLPIDDQHALEAWTARRDGQMALPVSSDSRALESRLRLRYDGTRAQEIRVDGHKIVVQVSEPAGREEDRRFRMAEILFHAPNLAAQQALLAAMSTVVETAQRAKRQPVFRMLSRYGSWERLDELPPRTLDSVVLPPGHLDALVADMERFFGAEADYARRCMPWHRAHLYEGPPGTGKTSVAKALASHFGLDIWYLPLADLNKDCDLLNLVGRIGPRSMLLLEDVDVFHAATARDDESGVTLSGLLNALDGVATPHGLFTVLTTNTPEVLDEAIVRPGRVDMVGHFELARSAQVIALLARWYDVNPHCFDHAAMARRFDAHGVAPATIVEVCKRHDTCEEALVELINVYPETQVA